MAKATDDRSTPAWVFDPLDAKFAFDLDVCATKGNRKCESYFGPDHTLSMYRDALDKDLVWASCGRSAWMNPPYSEIPKWLAKARREVLDADGDLRVVCLLPVSTSSQWFQRYIWHKQKRAWRELVGYVDFLDKRIDFAPHFTGAKWPNIVVELRLP